MYKYLILYILYEYFVLKILYFFIVTLIKFPCDIIQLIFFQPQHKIDNKGVQFYCY